MLAVGLALVSALLFGAMTVALRIAVKRTGEVELGAAAILYRGRVTVVSPLVATESLWGVALSAVLLRRSELVSRQFVLGAALIVAGGVLIGVYR